MGQGVSDLETQTIGSAGTLVAAGLETAGHYVQSSLLDVLEGGVAYSLGGLLYTIGAISAIFLIAIGGKYKLGAWLLVGPALFFTMVLNRVDSGGAEWQHGERLHDYSNVKLTVNGVVDPKKKMRVSWFFARWDTLTSGATQTFTKVMQLTDVKSDLKVIQRSQRYGAVFNAGISDPKLRSFVGLVTLDPTCVSMLGIKLMKTRAESEFVDKEIDAWIKALESKEKFSRSTKNFGFLKELENGKYFGDPPPPEIAKLLTQDKWECGDLWKLAVAALKNEARNHMQAVVTTNQQDGLEAGESFSELAKKFVTDDEDTNGIKLTDDEKMERIINFIVGRMMINALREIRPEMSSMFMHDALKQETARGGDPYSVAKDLRYLAKSYEYYGKGEYLSAMLALPYLQGVVLYFLAISFPFFAFALVIPGRHHTFFLWMGLWLWVKLWDFGFAVVMLVDELLYYLLPRGPVLNRDQLGDAEQTFQVLLQSDPIYSVQTYYAIVASLLASVPIITGVMVKKGGGEVLDAVGQGLRGFSGKIGTSMQAYSRSLMVSKLMAENEGIKEAAGRQALMNAVRKPEVLALLGMGRLTPAMIDQQIKANPNGFMKQVGDAAKKTTDEYTKELVNTYIDAEYKMAMWKVATSDPHLRENARRAVLLGWYEHPGFEADRPTGVLEELAIAQRNYQWGGAAANAIDVATNSLSNISKDRVLKDVSEAIGATKKK